MTSNTLRSRMGGAALGACLLAAVSFAPESRAATLWMGATTNFTQSLSQPVDVLIPGAVSLTRAGSRWLYNPAGGDSGPRTGSPSDTTWAFGSLANYQTLTYHTFDSYRNGDLSAVLTPNKPMVVHLVKEDIYLSLTFTKWPQGGGDFSYTRSTPATAVTPPTITTAPKSQTVAAGSSATFSVTVSGDAPLTYQWLFNSANIAGATNASLTINSVQVSNVGLYKVVVTNPGGSATSPTVQLNLAQPVRVSVPAGATASAFQLSISGNQGDVYQVQMSGDLATWQTLRTITNASGTVPFTDSTSSAASQRYYRVRLN